MNKIIILIILAASSIFAFSQEFRPAPDWYIKSLIHSHHSTGSPAPEWETQFREVRPDAVHFHAQAYSAGKELAEKYNFAMVTTFSRSGGWGDILHLVNALSAEEQKTIYKRENPDGSPAGRLRDGTIWEHACYHSPGIYEYIIPEYKKLTELYHPDQIWIDHTIVTVNLCYCENCRKNFQNQYNADPPILAGAPLWDEWVEYHRKGFEKWMKTVHDLVKDTDEKTLVTYNGAYLIAQPEPPPPYIRNLSMDIHSQLMHVCLYARYASTVGLPFDLMSGLTNKWAGTNPKTVQEVEQAAAIISANGGRWNIGEFPASQDKQPVDKMLELAIAGTNLIRERQEWTQYTSPVPLVAVLQSASTQYARVIPSQNNITKTQGDYIVSDNGTTTFVGKDNPGKSRIYWHNSLALPNEIYGAGAALLENSIPFDIINEAILKERLNEYKVLIVGDQFRLDHETVAAIRHFVEKGGGLIATGRTIESDLKELLGVQLSSDALLKADTIKINGSGVNLQSGLRISARGAKVLDIFSGPEGSPAVTVYKSGRGRVIYVAGDFFKTYMDASPYTPWIKSREGNVAMRKSVKDWIALVSPDLGFDCIAPPWIEVGLRTKDDKILMQMVEHSFEWAKYLTQDVEFIELKIDMAKRPEKVLLQPGAREVTWEWHKGKLISKIPVSEVKVHSILEIKGGLKNQQ